MVLHFHKRAMTLTAADIETERWLDSQRKVDVWLRPVGKGKRSLSQNALTWNMYGEIARHLGLTPEEAHNMCKLQYGVPILRRDSEKFRCFYDAHLKPLPYQSKLRAVEFISVSSVMTREQATEYIDTIVRAMAEQGLTLAMPGDVVQSQKRDTTT